MTIRTDSRGESSATFGGALFSRASRDADRDSILYKTPLAIAILSVPFQESIYLSFGADGAPTHLLIGGLKTGVICFSAALCLFSRSSWFGAALFTVTSAFTILPSWMIMANNIWLAMWTIPMALIFRQWWRSDLMRITCALRAFFDENRQLRGVDLNFVLLERQFSRDPVALKGREQGRVQIQWIGRRNLVYGSLFCGKVKTGEVSWP